MKIRENSSIHYIGQDDLDLDLFENQYLLEEGMAYNSYVIEDKQIAIVDTIDQRKGEEWKQALTSVLKDREPAYLVVEHLEPDHSALISWAMERYGAMQLICTKRCKQMLPQFFDEDFSKRVIEVKDGDTLSLGEHRLHFFAAPMVHWPEVLVAYEESEKVLFSADAFGKFGALAKETDDWTCEARRYYFNIVGKYGTSVQALLKKLSALEIQTICPLHGPVLKENLGYYTGLYDTWSKYEPEEKGVAVFYATLHGNTGKVAKKIAEMLQAKGETVALSDLSRADIAECVEDAFRYDRIVLCASSYDAGVMPRMQEFLDHLKSKAYQNRKVALVENGSWAPTAARVMRGKLEEMKNITIVEPVATMKTRPDEQTWQQVSDIVSALA